MNRYRIEHRISTIARLHEEFNLNGYHFSQSDKDSLQVQQGTFWIAKKTTEAESAQDAVNEFRKGLLAIVNKIAFVAQCATSADYQSFLIEKENDNQSGVFFFLHCRERKVVPLHFTSELIASLRKLETYSEKGDVFRYLQEETLASTYYSRLVILIAALEAMSGQRKTERGLTTNKSYIKKILQDEELYDKLFSYGDGVRNLILHGSKVNLTDPEHRDFDYASAIHTAIVAYFNKECGTSISNQLISVPRNPHGNYETFGIWLQPKKLGGTLGLQELVDLCPAGPVPPAPFWEKFQDAHPDPSKY